MRQFFFSLLAIFAASLCFAQVQPTFVGQAKDDAKMLASLSKHKNEVVEWAFTSEKISDQEFKLVFTATIKENWYVYSQFLKDGGPIPTSFQYNTEGIELVEKCLEDGNKKEGYDDLFMMDIVKYSKAVVFTQKVRLAQSTDVIKGYLTFMTCDDKQCLPPKDIDFQFDL